MDFITFEMALARAEDAKRRNDEACKLLDAVPGIGSGAMGLTPDHVRATPEYQYAKRQFDLTFQYMRECNQFVTSNFKKEYKAHIRAKRAAREAEWAKNAPKE